MRHVGQYCRFQPAIAGLFAHSQSLQQMQNHLAHSLPSPLNQHVQVANVRQDVLYLQVDASVWASRVRLLGPQILSAWKRHRNLPAVRRLKIRVRLPETEHKQKPMQAHRSAWALNQSSCQALQCLAETITEPALHNALCRLVDSTCTHQQAQETPD